MTELPVQFLTTFARFQESAFVFPGRFSIADLKPRACAVAQTMLSLSPESCSGTLRRSSGYSGFGPVGVADDRDDPIAAVDEVFELFEKCGIVKLEILLLEDDNLVRAEVAGQPIPGFFELARDG
jgi:hypothetical protein